MAAASTSVIVSALSTLYPALISDNINRQIVLPHLLDVLPMAGNAAVGTVKFSGKSAASAVAETATKALSDATTEVRAPYSFPRAKYLDVGAVTGSAEGVAETIGGLYTAESLLGKEASLLLAEASDSFYRLCEGIAAHCYSGQTGQTPEQIGGIATLIDSTGTVGGLAPGSYSEWVSVEDSVASASLTIDSVRTKLITPVFSACGKKPTFLITTPTLFDQLRAQYGAAAAPYITEIMLPAPRLPGQLPRPGRKMLLAGMDAFAIDGIPVFRDTRCTSGTIYAINTEHLWLEQLRRTPHDIGSVRTALADVNPSLLDMIAPGVVEEMAMAIRNARGIRPFFKELGATGDHTAFVTTADVALVTNRRNAHGKLAVT